MATRATVQDVGDIVSDVQDRRREALEAVGEVRDNLQDALDKSLKTRPYTTLMLAVAFGFVLGALGAVMCGCRPISKTRSRPGRTVPASTAFALLARLTASPRRLARAPSYETVAWWQPLDLQGKASGRGRAGLLRSGQRRSRQCRGSRWRPRQPGR